MGNEIRLTVDAEWVGGANMPSPAGRCNASWPFAVLRLEASRLTVRVRGFRRLCDRLEDHAPEEGDLVFPVTHLWKQGVGIRLGDGREFYFWTPAAETLLDTLRRAGFHVSDQPRPADVIGGRSRP